jgi:hypothetical protein
VWYIHIQDVFLPGSFADIVSTYLKTMGTPGIRIGRTVSPVLVVSPAAVASHPMIRLIS